MKKRLFSALLVLVMLLGLLTVSAFAESAETEPTEGTVEEHDAFFTDHDYIDENKNCVCDYSGCTYHAHADYNGNGVCDYGVCKVNFPHTHHDEENPNGTCDVPGCTEHVCYFEDGNKCKFCAIHKECVDANEDCKCDYGCTAPVHENDGDGFCENCDQCLHTKGSNGYCTRSSCKHVNCKTCGGAKPATKYYTIKAGDSKHGDIVPEGKVEVAQGGSVTFRFKPEKGYEVSAIYIDGAEIDGDGECYEHGWICYDYDWTCKDHKHSCDCKYDVFGDWIEWSRWFDCDHDCDYDCWYDDACWYDYCDGCYWVVGENKITFKNVQGNHSLYVEFAPVKEDCPSAAYKDLNTDAWYHEATDYVIENSLMKGKSATKFDPSGATTRGQLVTMLYRLAGEPAVSGESEFDDVKDGEWYTKAVIWAAKKGIVTGYGDGTFGVEDAVTREQTVAILYRYAKAMRCDVSDVDSLKEFLDVEEVSEYALTAFGWAVEDEIIKGKASGKNLKLDPQGVTIRVEMAAMLMRFAEYVD